MNSPPLVLGMDPGFASFGYALLTPAGDVVDLGVIRTAPSGKKAGVLRTEDNLERCRTIARELRRLIYHVPDAGPLAGHPRVRLLCAEAMSFPRSASVAAKMAMSWGLVMSHVEMHDLPLLQASPQEVKRRVCGGNAAASKSEVERAMLKRYGKGLNRMLKGVPDGQREHAFDALAVATGCLDSHEARMLRAWGN